MSLQNLNKDMQPGPPSLLEREPEGGEAEFYIGWQPSAPKGFSAWVKKYLFVLLPIVILLGVSLALSQKKFGTGNFEFGTLTEVKGIYFSNPVSVIRVVNGKDIWGNENFITVPLIGYGKHGAEGTIADIEKEVSEGEKIIGRRLFQRSGFRFADVQAHGDARPATGGFQRPGRGKLIVGPLFVATVFGFVRDVQAVAR